MKLLAALLAMALLAGCIQDDAATQQSGGTAGPTETPPTPTPPTTPPVAPPPHADITLCGAVVDEAVRPIAGATVASPRSQYRTTTTAADGTFCLGFVADAVHLVTASLPDGRNKTVSWSPSQGRLTIVMPALPATEAYQVSQTFSGMLQCAHEALIISGSCDTLARFGNDNVEPLTGGRPLPEPLEAHNEFDFHVEAGWKTLVFDVSFDPAAQPGLAGLRAVLRGPAARDDLYSYEQYGRWNGTGPFTFRVEPGGNYTGGDVSVPAIQDLFQLEVLPHSHLYHQVCDNSGETCFLGVGAGLDVEFQVVVTAFYVEPAPEGYTLL